MGREAPADTAGLARVAVLIPCYNEALTVGKVIDDFRAALAGATIYVYDNNSTDDTAAIAREHGAVVRFEPRQGKGNVVRSMFRDIEADCYLMVDGDDTYTAEQALELCRPILEGAADMTVGDRLSNGTYAAENQRAFHGFGNNLVRGLIRIIYGYTFNDVMTGYRAMSHLFVKTMPVLSPGFQIECELSIHAVDKRWRIVEVPIVYRDRPAGSESKLSTVHDGVRVVSSGADALGARGRRAGDRGVCRDGHGNQAAFCRARGGVGVLRRAGAGNGGHLGHLGQECPSPVGARGPASHRGRSAGKGRPRRCAGRRVMPAWQPGAPAGARP